MKDAKIFSSNEENNKMAVSNIKMYQQIKNKILLSIEKNHKKVINFHSYRKLFLLLKYGLFSASIY